MTIIKELLEEANQHHNLAINAMKSSLIHARDAGERLAEIKKHCKHGQFEALIEEHGAMMPRTAQRYMQIFREYPAIEEKMGPGKAAVISLAEGLRLIQSKEKEYYPEAQSNPPDETLLVEDEDLSICPRNGLHEYIEGDDCCRHCHTPKVDIDEMEERAARARAAVDAESDTREAKRLMAKTESHYCELVRQIDQINKLMPFPRKDDVQSYLDASYQLFRQWRHEK